MDPLGDPIPVGGLFGKNAKMPERCRLEFENQRLMPDRPRLGKRLTAAPFSFAAGAPLVASSHAGPQGRVGSSQAIRRRAGAIDEHAGESLQLSPVAEVNQFVLVAGEHSHRYSKNLDGGDTT